jgi:hypothetical protein
VDLAMSRASPGERGHFTLLRPDVGSPESRNLDKQESLWAKSLEWSGVTREDTALSAL